MKNEIEALDNLMNSMAEEDQKTALENRFPYLFSKAYTYLKIGPSEYRKMDYFKLPEKSLDKDELERITSGCKQITIGHGFKRESPFTKLNIRGFNLLFELMHFELTERKSEAININGKKCFIDEMHLKHSVDKSEITYYNLVEYL